MDFKEFNSINHPIDIIKVSQKIYIVGLCWDNKTEKQTKMNNLIETIAYLKSKFENRFFFARFTNKIQNKFRFPIFNSKNKNKISHDGYISQIFEYSTNLEELFNFCKIIKGWLFDDNIVVIENRNKKFTSLYVQALIYYLNFDNANLNRTFENLKENDLFFNDFYHILENFKILTKKINFKELKIEQIIISMLKFTKRININFKINNKSCGKIELLDDNYVIARFNEKIEGNTLLEIMSGNNLLIRIEFNSYVYDEGLFRFTVEHFQSSDKPFQQKLPLNSQLCKNTYVDIVFREIRTIPNPYENKNSVQMLIDTFDENIDKVKLRNLIMEGYDKNYAKLALIIYKNQNDAKKFLQNKNKNVVERNYLKICNEYDAKNSNILDFNALKLLPEKLENKKSTPMMPIFKNKLKIPTLIKKNLSVKPFHWETTRIIPGSFFSEFSNTKTKIDFELFEKMFCESKKVKKIENNKSFSSVSDQKRLFLISLSIKTLEKKTLKKSSDFMKLNLEDLKLAKILIPKENELKQIKSKNSEIDRIMLHFKNFESLIEILIFERQFINTLPTLENSIEILTKSITALIINKNLKKIFKIVLDLGNYINFTYGNKNTEQYAFKLKSLELIPQYKSNFKNQTLLTFLIQILKTDPGFYNIFKELICIHSAKDQDLSAIKDTINEFILIYENLKYKIIEIDQDVVNDLISFFSYFYVCINRLSKKYLLILESINELNIKFNEDSKTKICDIFKILSQFLLLLENEYKLL